MKCVENFPKNNSLLPCRKNIINLIKDIRNLIYPGFFNCIDNNLEEVNASLYDDITKILTLEISKAINLANLEANADYLCNQFMNQLDNLCEILKTDLNATFEGDPAAFDYNEIILTYPGLFAISVYRIAHILYELGIPYLPRIMMEYAHSKTGIDIHPGATIGPYFFIDHGTGIVIGETTTIGHHVRIYQGVTLGALSLGRGQKLKGSKRHPSIGNYVTIYSGASILGGDTIIGDNVIVGANTYILESIPANHIVRLSKVDMDIEKRK